MTKTSKQVDSLRGHTKKKQWRMTFYHISSEIWHLRLFLAQNEVGQLHRYLGWRTKQSYLALCLECLLPSAPLACSCVYLIIIFSKFSPRNFSSMNFLSGHSHIPGARLSLSLFLAHRHQEFHAYFYKHLYHVVYFFKWLYLPLLGNKILKGSLTLFIFHSLGV